MHKLVSVKQKILKDLPYNNCEIKRLRDKANFQQIVLQIIFFHQINY